MLLLPVAGCLNPEESPSRASRIDLIGSTFGSRDSRMNSEAAKKAGVGLRNSPKPALGSGSSLHPGVRQQHQRAAMEDRTTPLPATFPPSSDGYSIRLYRIDASDIFMPK
jgi:hypothetical protein